MALKLQNADGNLFFELNMMWVPEDFFIGDVKDVAGSRHLIFATAQQLELLRKTKRWFMDGTFIVVAPLYSIKFYQMYSIHAFVRHEKCIKQVKLVLY